MNNSTIVILKDVATARLKRETGLIVQWAEGLTFVEMNNMHGMFGSGILPCNDYEIGVDTGRRPRQAAGV